MTSPAIPTLPAVGALWVWSGNDYDVIEACPATDGRPASIVIHEHGSSYIHLQMLVDTDACIWSDPKTIGRVQ